MSASFEIVARVTYPYSDSDPRWFYDVERYRSLEIGDALEALAGFGVSYVSGRGALRLAREQGRYWVGLSADDDLVGGDD